MFLFLLAACARHDAAPTLPPDEWSKAINWTAARDEAAQLLSGYLQTDTVNPPGNETNGAKYLGAILEKEGIPYEIIEFAPNRGSLIARLDGADQEPPLCLLSHTDVVTSEASLWPPDKQPLSGVIDENGMIWGRGALDMKSLGLIETLTLVWLKRLNLPLKRDVILLAVADEEVDSQGMKHVIAERWDSIRCSQVVNEGGIGIKDLLFEGQTVYPISVGEKGTLWTKMIASGPAGHGSTPRPGYAPETLMAAVDALEKRKDRADIHPAMYEFLHRVGESKGGFTGMILKSKLLVNLLVKPSLMESPPTHATLTNTVHLTGFGGALSPNVVPAEVYANLDIRLLPGVTPEAMLAEVEHLTRKVDNLRFEVTHQSTGNDSTWEDPFFDALVNRATAGRDDAVAGPIISPGFTDSILLRPLGVRAYGFMPFEITEEELATMHGHGERISVENLGNGLKILLGAVVDVVQ